jgi:DNA-binding XRE family transcriptional regulator
VGTTTAKAAAVRANLADWIPVAGQLMPGTPKHCRDCGKPMVPESVREHPDGHVRHQGRGYCGTCYGWRQRAGHVWDGPRPERTLSTSKQWRAADLVAEWDFLRIHCGLNREQAAERLGVKPSTLTTAAHRARKYAERDKLRAEISAAETEAHRINDDMIAYAARKQAAA